MDSSTKFDNKGKDILILGLGPTQGLGVKWVFCNFFFLLLLLYIKNEWNDLL